MRSLKPQENLKNELLDNSKDGEWWRESYYPPGRGKYWVRLLQSRTLPLGNNKTSPAKASSLWACKPWDIITDLQHKSLRKPWWTECLLPAGDTRERQVICPAEPRRDQEPSWGLGDPPEMWAAHFSPNMYHWRVRRLLFSVSFYDTDQLSSLYRFSPFIIIFCNFECILLIEHLFKSYRSVAWARDLTLIYQTGWTHITQPENRIMRVTSSSWGALHKLKKKGERGNLALHQAHCLWAKSMDWIFVSYHPLG